MASRRTPFSWALLVGFAVAAAATGQDLKPIPLEAIPQPGASYVERAETAVSFRELAYFRAEIASRSGRVDELRDALETLRSTLGVGVDARLHRRVFSFPASIVSVEERRGFILETVLPYLFRSHIEAPFSCGRSPSMTLFFYVEGVRYTGESSEGYACRSGSVVVASLVREFVSAAAGKEPITVRTTSLEIESPWVQVFYPDGVSFTVTSADEGAHTLFSTAASTGQIEVMEVLREAGADLDVASDSGYTALHYGVVGGSRESVEWLVDAGASLEARTNDGRTAAHLAAASGSVDLIRYLSQAGAGLDTRDAAGQTPLLTAIRHGHTAAVMALLDRGADPDIPNANGETPLMRAVVRRLDVVDEFVSAGADVRAVDASGYTALHHAVRSVFASAVPVLIASGSDVDAKSSDGSTPLHVSAEFGSVDVARILVERGAGLELRDDHQDTPLITAAGAGQSRMVEFLLRSGASRSARNAAGQNARRAARDNGQRPVNALFKHIKPLHFTFLKMGTNLARLNDPQHASSVGGEFGVSAALRVHPRIRVQADLASLYRITDPEEDGAITIPGTGDYYYWINTIEVRPSLRFAVGNPYRSHLYALAGIAYGSVVNVELRDWTGDSEDETVTDASSESFTGFNAGLGYEWVVGRLVVTLEATYSRASAVALEEFEGGLDTFGLALGFGL